MDDGGSSSSMHQIKTCNPFHGFSHPAERIKGQPHFAVLIVQAGCKGRDIERRVLAEAVRLHLADSLPMKVGNTAVFRNLGGSQ